MFLPEEFCMGESCNRVDSTIGNLSVGCRNFQGKSEDGVWTYQIWRVPNCNTLGVRLLICEVSSKEELEAQIARAPEVWEKLRFSGKLLHDSRPPSGINY